ncbi:hypothetical protein ACFWDI_25105 [Streptomyces sp. NPDC060064]|uniref:hypothetical protein n=1 Tax=Streptomyces sp. NPDC060064 TaxID=3347049 RepID=UPI0036BE8DEF
MDQTEQGPLPRGGGCVPLAVHGSLRDLETFASAAEIDGLVGHGPQDVPGQGGVVGSRGELHGQDEVLLGYGVLTVVECHPPGQVRKLGGG